MALSRRMAAPFFVVLLVIVAAETAMARVVPDEKHCWSQSQVFKGTCWPWGDTNCGNICKTEKFSDGECRVDGLQGKCYCKKVC